MLQDVVRLARLYVFGSMKNAGFCFADDFFWLVAIHSPCTFVPQQNLAIKVLADDGILGRRFENIDNEVPRLMGAADKGAITKKAIHDNPPLLSFWTHHCYKGVIGLWDETFSR